MTEIPSIISLTLRWLKHPFPSIQNRASATGLTNLLSPLPLYHLGLVDYGVLIGK